MNKYQPNKKIIKLVKQVYDDIASRPKHGCEDPNCDGVKYEEMGGMTLCEADAHESKVLNAYE